jgi:hypothetical protein
MLTENRIHQSEWTHELDQKNIVPVWLQSNPHSSFLNILSISTNMLLFCNLHVDSRDEMETVIKEVGNNSKSNKLLS